MTEEINLTDAIQDALYTEQDIREVVEEGFLAYAAAVISGRALPDVRDGCKPVHRRTIYAQHILGNASSKTYKKSARIVGDVIGKYHPHGDSAVYDALARLTQSFSMCAPLADGQGNFGSRDGDKQAAMRYTEVRMSKVSESMLQDIGYDTVDFEPNYDGSEQMPSVLPTRFPNLLVNGSDGIAVGMACKVPSHNPIEAMRCVIAILEAEKEGRKPSVDELIELMPAPDYPTGGLIHGLENYRDAWTGGRSKFKIRAKWQEETVNNHRAIVVTELPYNVNKAKLIENIAEKTTPNKDEIIVINGVFSVNDETTSEDINGVRVVIELKNGYDPEIVFNELCKRTPLEDGFSYNMNVIKGGRPVMVGIYEALYEFVRFREEVVLRRSRYILARKNKRMHTLAGLKKAIDKMDETIETIRASKGTAESNIALQKLLDIDESQAADILAMKLQSLASAAMDDIINEYDKVATEISELDLLIANRDKQIDLMIEESEQEIDRFLQFKDPRHMKKLLTKRRSEYQVEEINITREDLIAREECALIMTDQGFIRRVPSSEINTQRRGTRGKSQMVLAKKDFISQTTNCNSHDIVAFVTNLGLISFVKAFDIETDERGQHVNNLLKLEEGEKVIRFAKITENMLDNDEDINVVVGTERGLIKRTKLSVYNTKRNVSVYTIKLEQGDQVKFLDFGSDTADICMVASNNLMIRFKMGDVRETSRFAKGVRSMSLKDNAKVQCGAIVEEDMVDVANIGCVSHNGILKISKVSNYKLQRRGGMGLIAMNLDEGDSILSTFIFSDDEEKDVVTTTKSGVVNRVDVGQYRVTNRRSKGSRLVKFDAKKDKLVTAVLANKDNSEESEMTEDIELDNQVEVTSED
ncbi:DNA gyrase/topoisomerase IV subunit A [Vibrio crassostreae]|uniref:DNA gyrase/topoisomerase IV subunit A n=1 Tax=Vibrio crassostreae TaxID=246167 RepID=UPI001B30BFF2|nr:DNA topoisomerase (ATP-hydrolyzing) [Vibrio crassostreae]